MNRKPGEAGAAKPIKRRAAAKPSDRVPAPPAPVEAGPAASIAALFAAALQHHQAGRLAPAEGHYRQILAVDPNHVDSLHLLGVIASHAGRNDAAVDLIGKAIALNDREPAFHSNLGNALQGQGRLDEAAASYRRALALDPDYAKAHYNLGKALKDRGKLDEAVVCYRRAIVLEPDYAKAHNNLGNVLQGQGKPAEAAASYGRALALDPNFADAHNNLAGLLVAQGEPIRAWTLIRRSLELQETPEAKRIFMDCVKHPRFTRADDAIRATLVRALSEPWGRPSGLAAAGARLVKLSPDIADGVARAIEAWPRLLPARDLFGPSGLARIAADRLLRCLLESAPICDIALERFLTMARRAMLDAATGAAADADAEPSVLDFYCALVRQCFIDEYVFAQSEEESSRARSLRDDLVAALQAGNSIPVRWLVAVAAYFPLHSLPLASRLLDKPWPDAVSAVLTQQLREPDEERQYGAGIARLTAIEDDVSLRVQRQYEENPYPRWIKPAPAGTPTTIDAYLRQRFPAAPFRALDNTGAIDILIAGCGTGQHSIETARRFRNARVLAIDLSLTSLCYAKRKTLALGLTAIEYAQADILKLESLQRSFDIVESVGVLHHLDRPMAGWRALLSLLRPGGVMCLGFYSETARQDVVRARAFIARQGYGQAAEEIRRGRQDLIDDAENAGLATASISDDFFSLSACRDLLFHVQEHRMTLPGIDAFLKENDLQFLGFNLESRIIEKYRTRFPDDKAASDLALWHDFETDNPETFAAMYQFWIQKPDRD
jgi:Tfp pilus assembly protein PilF/SAM-dependent methyltransferase